MKRVTTISMTLALVLVSNLSVMAASTKVDHHEFQKVTIVNGGDGGCKGDDKDPCEPPRNQ